MTFAVRQLAVASGAAAISFVVPGVPVPWARAGSHGKRRFTPPMQFAYMTAVRFNALTAMRGLRKLDGAVELTVTAVWPWPEKYSARRRVQPGADRKATKPDASNVVKIIEDALIGIVFTDDARVSDLVVRKRYGDHPGVTIQVRGA